MKEVIRHIFILPQWTRKIRNR